MGDNFIIDAILKASPEVAANVIESVSDSGIQNNLRLLVVPGAIDFCDKITDQHLAAYDFKHRKDENSEDFRYRSWEVLAKCEDKAAVSKTLDRLSQTDEWEGLLTGRDNASVGILRDNWDKPYVSDTLYKRMAEDRFIARWAVDNNLGGRDSLKLLATHVTEGEAELRRVCLSPHIDDEILDIVKDRIDDVTARALLENPMHTQAMYDRCDEEYVANPSYGFLQALCKSIHAREDKIKELYSKEEGKGFSYASKEGVNAAFLNPKYGYKIFADMPDKIHPYVEKQPQVKWDKGFPKVFLAKSGEDYKLALKALGDQESVTWKDFKTKNPSLAQKPSIQKIGQQNKQMVSRQALMDEINRSNQDDGYHISFHYWRDDSPYSGCQRHNDNKNLVVQLNITNAQWGQISSDPDLLYFYQNLSAMASHSHPYTPYTAGWVRVDTTSVKNGWIIEEIQSDWGPTFNKALYDNTRDSGTIKIGSKTYSYEEAVALNKKLENIIGDWHIAAFNGMEEFAKQQGMETLHIHGLGVRASLLGGGSKHTAEWQYRTKNKTFSQDEWEILGDEEKASFGEVKKIGVPKLEMYYFQEPRKRGYEEINYTNIPNHNPKLAKNASYMNESVPAKIWRKKLV